VSLVPLKRLATVKVSNVDKKTLEGDVPVRLCNYTDVYYRDRICSDQDFMLSTATREQVGTFRLAPGDVIITKDSETADDIGVPSYVESSAHDLVCGYHLAMLRPVERRIDGRFLFWSMASTAVREQFAVSATGVTRFGLRSESIDGCRIWCPSEGRQRAIADFLDAETARIDALIVKKRRLVVALGERLEAEVAEVLSGTAEVELRRTAELLPGFTFSSDDFAPSGDGPRLLRGVNVGIGAIRWYDVVHLQGSDQDLGRYVVEAGDIVLGMDRPFISGGTRVAEVKENDAGSLLVQRVCRIRMDSPGLRTIVRHSLASRRFSAYVESDLTGVSVPHLSESQIGSFRVPRPVGSELDQCAHALWHAEEQHARLTKALEQQIELLAEHRQSLITAAVTGEIEVPGAAA